ncbi:MAG: hypothetical protein K9M75_11060 [Phycisphaerae bacterium]|nr:hypothetical protein [Phycisphaerae bacterium]
MNTRKGIKSLLIIVVTGIAVMVTSASAEITVDGSATWQSGNTNLGGTFDASDSDKLVVIVTGEHGFNQTGNGFAGDVFYDGVQLTAAVKRQPIKANVDPLVLVDDTYNAIYYLDNPGTVHVAGAITTSGFQSRGSVAVVALSGTEAGVGNVVTGARDTNTADLTTADGSIVIGSYGLGGTGNTAQLAPITTPDWDAELARQENGSNWDGHVVAYKNYVAAGTATYTFDDTTLPGADGRTGRHVIAAEFVNAFADPNLPDVDLGDDWITWSGRSVTLAPEVVNNDTQVPQRTLNYAWTADPADGVVFTPDANVEAPDVTITKAAGTGDATVVKLMLSVTIDGVEGVVEEDINIDVYDDSCAAAVAIGTAAIFNPADFNQDCITDIQDLAAIAAEWLNNYSLTAPTEAP